MARLGRINIHPVKSLDPQAVDEAILLPSGALEHDRRFALVGHDRQFMNAKRSAACHRLRSRFDPASARLELRTESSAQWHVFDLASERVEASIFLSNYFGTPLALMENLAAGFPDDTDSPGPTVIATATLVEVGRWFDLSLEETRRRFRANLEIDDVEPFWEDRLVTDEPRGAVRFEIGQAALLGTNPCQRCPVPTRDSHSGEPIRGFAKRFSELRERSLPEFAAAARFDHFYRLALNTRRVAGAAVTIRVGDDVRIVGVE